MVAQRKETHANRVDGRRRAIAEFLSFEERPDGGKLVSRLLVQFTSYDEISRLPGIGFDGLIDGCHCLRIFLPQAQGVRLECEKFRTAPELRIADSGQGRIRARGISAIHALTCHAQGRIVPLSLERRLRGRGIDDWLSDSGRRFLSPSYRGSRALLHQLARPLRRLSALASPPQRGQHTRQLGVEGFVIWKA